MGYWCGMLESGDELIVVCRVLITVLVGMLNGRGQMPCS